MHRGLSALRATGAEVYGTFLEALMAEAMGRAARVSEAMNLIHQAIRVARSKEERFYEPELHRLKGELLQIGGSTSSEVASCFQEAIEIARRQGAKSLELRAATSLARLWRDQGKPSEAQQMLAETYGWFTEGLDTADLKEAKALLEELQQPNVPISARH
jgi:predicted ATPase